MAAGRFVVPPYFPARNRDFDLLSGAKLYVYDNLTTDKANIYTDEALTVLSANPVIANSSGQFPAIWAQAGTEAEPVLYSVSVTTSTGASPGNPFNFDNYRPSVDWETAAAALAEAAAATAVAEATAAAASADEAAADAVLTAADLAAIEAIIADAPDAPSVLNKLDRDGDNASAGLLAAIGEQTPDLTAISAPIVDSDILTGYRSGLKRLTASIFADYIKAFFSASGGSALVGYISSGTGAAAETAQAALRRTVYSDQYATPQQAITAAGSGGTVIFKPGGTTTLTTPLLLTGLNNVRLVGYGHTLQCGATRISGYIDCSGTSNAIIEGFNFDGRQSAMPIYTNVDYAVGIPAYVYNTPVIADGTVAAWSNLTVRNCTLTGLYTNFVWVYTGSGLTVSDCVLNAPVCNQTYNGTPGAQQWSFVYVQTVAGAISIHDNQFIGAATTNPALPPAAVFLSGTNGQQFIYANTSEYCGRNNTGLHRLAVYDLYGDCSDTKIFDNASRNAMAAFARVSAASRVDIHNNSVHTNANADTGEYNIGVFGNISFAGRGVEDVSIENNIFEDSSSRHPYNIQVAAYDWGRPSRRIKINGNTITGSLMGCWLSGPFDGFDFNDNIVDGDVAVLYVTPTPGVALTSIYGTEANSMYDRFRANRNVIYNSNAASGRNGIQLALGVSTTAYVGDFEVSDNALRSASTTANGFVFQVFSATLSNTRLVFRGNRTRGYAYGAYFRDGGEFVFEDNRFVGWATAPILDGGGYNSLHRSGNRFASGTLSGSATLVAGTVTVSNTEFRTGDRVMLSRKTVGGTAGLSLVQGALTNGTSLVVNAVDASGAVVTTDTSVFDYDIVH